MDKSDNVIRFDWAAKFILRDKADFVILEGLVSAIIGETIHITQLLESESNKQHKNDKSNRVDIKALNSLDEIIIIEIQFADDLNFVQRILYSTAKTITEHLKIGQDYHNVKKVFSINILYYNLGYGEDYLYHGQSELLGVHTGDRLIIGNKKKKRGAQPKATKNIFPEYYVLRVSKFDENKEPTTPEEEWALYLKTGYIDPNTKTPGLREALERLKLAQLSEEDLKEYKDYEFNQRFEENVINAARIEGEEKGLEEGFEQGLAAGREEGREEGREVGREEGREEVKKEIAQKMKDAGLYPEVITQIIGIETPNTESHL